MNIPEYLLELVNQYFGDYITSYKWFFVKNPAFGYVSPYQMLKLGKEKDLAKWITIQLANNEIL